MLREGSRSWRTCLVRLFRLFVSLKIEKTFAPVYLVLMDELNQLVTAKQGVVYKFFNWRTLVGSKRSAIAVANTMDLLERVMTGRVRSRLGETSSIAVYWG